jgi:hypothetical protein
MSAMLRKTLQSKAFFWEKENYITGCPVKKIGVTGKDIIFAGQWKFVS